MAATFTVVVSNVGNARRGFDTPLTATIDDGAPQEVSAAPPLNAGDSSQLLFNLHLTPGRQQIRVQVDESISIIAMEILASDVVLSTVAYQVVGEGLVEFTVKATNAGAVPTGPITIVADAKVVGTIPPLQDGEEGNLEFQVELPAGEHTVTVNAAPDDREVNTLNNDAVFNIKVDYVALVIEPLAQSTKGFTRSGGANVSLGFKVQNLGVAPSGDFTVAFQCKNDPDQLCEGSTQVASLLPGGQFQGTIDAVLPQGTVNLELYAGKLEHDYRLGHDNVETVTVEVPIQPPVDLVFEVPDPEITGYYADGSAQVNVTATLVNNGSDPVNNLRDVLISCRQDGQIVAGCGTVLALELDDGYGPTSASETFKVPTGNVSLILDGGDVNGAAEISVPKRITFIDRETWDCFADSSWSSTFPRGNCGGQDSTTIEKWQNDQIIKFWANGDDRYVDVLEDVLADLASELGILYDWVREENDADVVAHVGLTIEQAKSAGFIECEGLWGCSSTTAASDGSIDSALLVVYQNTEEPYASLGLTSDVVQYGLTHHLVKVLAPLNYRNVPDSVMSIDTSLRTPDLSPSDIDIIDLIRHELVAPGATVSEIRDLVIFREELVDSTETPTFTNLDLIARARKVLHNSGTALYELTGNWAGGECDTSRPRFGPAQVTFGEFSGNRSRSYRMVTENEQWMHLVSADRQMQEYWDGSGRRWRNADVADEQKLISSTAWSPEFGDPLVILASMLWFGRESQISIVRSDDAERVLAIELSNGFANPEWATRSRLDIKNITIDVETYVIQSFEAVWEFTVRGLACSQFQIEADLESYGGELDIPDDIQEDSAILSPAR